MSDDRLNEIELIYNDNKRLNDRYWISGAQLDVLIVRADRICEISTDVRTTNLAETIEWILSHIGENQFLRQKTDGLLAYIEANQFENEEDPTTEG